MTEEVKSLTRQDRLREIAKELAPYVVTGVSVTDAYKDIVKKMIEDEEKQLELECMKKEICIVYNTSRENLDKALEVYQTFFFDLASCVTDMLTPMIGAFKELAEESCGEENIYSEKELRKRIKYSKTPMEAKQWNKILNERLRSKKVRKKQK